MDSKCSLIIRSNQNYGTKKSIPNLSEIRS